MLEHCWSSPWGYRSNETSREEITRLSVSVGARLCASRGRGVVPGGVAVVGLVSIRVERRVRAPGERGVRGRRERWTVNASATLVRTSQSDIAPPGWYTCSLVPSVITYTYELSLTDHLISGVVVCAAGERGMRLQSALKPVSVWVARRESSCREDRHLDGPHVRRGPTARVEPLWGRSGLVGYLAASHCVACPGRCCPMTMIYSIRYWAATIARIELVEKWGLTPVLRPRQECPPVEEPGADER